MAAGRAPHLSDPDVGVAAKDFLIVLVVLAAASLFRYAAIEPAPIRHACASVPWEGWCALRTVLMLPFRHQEIGWIAMAAAAVGFVLRSAVRRPLASAAPILARGGLYLGAAGLVLYSADPSAVAALLGAFTLVRLRAGDPQPTASTST